MRRYQPRPSNAARKEYERSLADVARRLASGEIKPVQPLHEYLAEFSAKRRAIADDALKGISE